MSELNRRYVGRAGRPELYGRACRVVTGWRGRHSIRNVLLEFADGLLVVTHVRCIRKLPAPPAKK